MEKHQHSPRWPFVKKVAWMVSSLGAGVTCAVGHHLFYQQLNGTTPPNTSYLVWGFPHGISRQQLNISVGNAFAFFTKACLAIAVASAHDQISWRTIRRRPTKLRLIDHLFSSRDDIASALEVQLWWQMPTSTLLLIIFWLLPLAPLVSPSTLTIQTSLLNTTISMRTPRTDFTSLNFASFSWNVSRINELVVDKKWASWSLDYEKPQFTVQKAVQGSLGSGTILPITAPGPNATWNLEFDGPALSCEAFKDTEWLSNINITELDAPSAKWRYLSWTPTDAGGVPANFSDATTVDSSLLALYVMIPPPVSYLNAENSTVVVYEPDMVVYREGSTYLLQCTLQNVSYTADFSYVNGVQDVALSTSAPLNNVSRLSGLGSYRQLNSIHPSLPNYTTIALDQFDAQTFAYQAVMDAFASVFVGSIREVSSTLNEQTSILYTVSTSMGTTTLLQAREMVNVTQALASQSNLLANVQWAGDSLEQIETGTRPMADLMEEMFRNATVSLMNIAALNPNYTSPFAPPNATVQLWTSQNLYQYAASTLWVTYGTVIGLSALSVLVGATVVLGERAAYSTCFSTLLRVAYNVHLPAPLKPRDVAGQGPLPEHLSSVEVWFPPSGTTVFRTVKEEEVDRQRSRLDNGRLLNNGVQD